MFCADVRASALGLESLGVLGETAAVLLDQLLDRAQPKLAPFAVCELRGDVCVEVVTTEDAHLYCVLFGSGVLCIDGGSRTPIASASLAIVPAGIAHGFEPPVASARCLLLRPAPADGSDHLPTVSVGRGELALSFVAARLQATRALLEPLKAPLVVALAELPGARAWIEWLEDEQRRRLPGLRSMSALALQAGLIHALRARPALFSGERENASASDAPP